MTKCLKGATNKFAYGLIEHCMQAAFISFLADLA